jgi:hypothetical protein
MANLVFPSLPAILPIALPKSGPLSAQYELVRLGSYLRSPCSVLTSLISKVSI